ncbi:hypothetical protein UNDYM_6012 (plasmid) [Undibacterium sp. YM2]|nr:hypothetical protein UNDYM_6012 [Undibacterium sp. YM2]
MLEYMTGTVSYLILAEHVTSVKLGADTQVGLIICMEEIDIVFMPRSRAYGDGLPVNEGHRCRFSNGQHAEVECTRIVVATREFQTVTPRKYIDRSKTGFIHTASVAAGKYLSFRIEQTPVDIRRVG